MFVHSKMENHQIFSDSKSVGDFTYCSQIKKIMILKSGQEIVSCSWFLKNNHVFETHSCIWRKIHEFLELVNKSSKKLQIHKSSKKSQILKLVLQYF